LECVCLLPHRRAEAGLDDPRGHAVDSDVTVGQLRGQRPGQTQQRRLTHTVRAQGLQRHRALNTHSRWTSPPIDLLILSLTCIGWYPATEDTNTTFPPLKRQKRIG